MKNLLIAAILIAGYSSANAQKINDADVPAAAKAKFKIMFPNVTTVKWEKEDGNYEANFTDKSIVTSASFSTAGKWMETEQEIKSDALPENALDYLNKHAGGKPIKDASKSTNSAGRVTFEAGVGDTDYIFDQNGNFLKTEKDND